MKRFALIVSLLASSAFTAIGPACAGPIENHRPAPAVYSIEELAKKIAAAQNEAVAPILGKPVSLTPLAPAVPGVAGWTLFDVNIYMAIDKTDKVNAEPSGYVIFGKSTDARIDLYVRVEKGKRYATDCRTDVSTLFYYVYMPTGQGTGVSTIITDPQSHSLFLTGPVLDSGWMRVGIHLSHDKYQPIGRTVWGCEIIPF